MSDIQQRVQRALDRLAGSGAERGVQAAVYLRGEPVVDAVAGVADPATGRPVTPATPFYNFSIGKGAASTLTHQLVDRGVFGYDTRVAELWPEFARHGKDAVTVRHVLTHSAGVPGLPAGTTAEDVCDWDTMCAALVEAAPWWEPGTAVGYHAYTFGFLIGEVVRRATGRPIGQVLREELAEPLGVGDELYFGMPRPEHGRLARLEDAGDPAAALASVPRDAPLFKASPAALLPTAALGNRTDILAADIPATGKTSARAIARMYAALLGGVPGVRLIAPERLPEVAGLAASGTDQVFGNPSSWALGYALWLPGATSGAATTAFGMAGAGGSYAYGDPATGIAFALTKNRLTPDFAAVEEINGIVLDALGRG